jgi:hypothetical protein
VFYGSAVFVNYSDTFLRKTLQINRRKIAEGKAVVSTRTQVVYPADYQL